MSADDPFVTVRRRIIDDPRFADVYADATTLGWWLKLLLGADAAWPASAELPRSCPAASVTALAAVGLVVVYPHGRYRMPDHDQEREARSRAAGAGGRGRARSASRDASGQFQRSLPAVAGQREDQRASPAVAVQRDPASQSTTEILLEEVASPPAPERATPTPVGDLDLVDEALRIFGRDAFTEETLARVDARSVRS